MLQDFFFITTDYGTREFALGKLCWASLLFVSKAGASLKQPLRRVISLPSLQVLSKAGALISFALTIIKKFYNIDTRWQFRRTTQVGVWQHSLISSLAFSSWPLPSDKILNFLPVKPISSENLWPHIYTQWASSFIKHIFKF